MVTTGASLCTGAVELSHGITVPCLTSNKHFSVKGEAPIRSALHAQ